MAAAWTVQNVRDLGPASLSTVGDSVIQIFIDQADAQIDPRVFGASTVYAGAQLTLHMMAMAGKIPGFSLPGGGVGVTGPVASITVGSVSTSFGGGGSSGGSGNDGDLMRTQWGSEYVRIRDMKAGGPWLAGTVPTCFD